LRADAAGRAKQAEDASALGRAAVLVGTTIIRVRVKPSARTASFVQLADGSYLASVRATPIEGKANRELLALIASHFECPKSAVSLKSGASGRTKLVRIEAR